MGLPDGGLGVGYHMATCGRQRSTEDLRTYLGHVPAEEIVNMFPGAEEAIENRRFYHDWVTGDATEKDVALSGLWLRSSRRQLKRASQHIDCEKACDNHVDRHTHFGTAYRSHNDCRILGWMVSPGYKCVDGYEMDLRGLDDICSVYEVEIEIDHHEYRDDPRRHQGIGYEHHSCLVRTCWRVGHTC